MEFTHFMAAIDALGTTEVERAAKLGISDRQLLTWRKEGPPRPIRRLLNHPILLCALFQDAQSPKQPSVSS